MSRLKLPVKQLNTAGVKTIIWKNIQSWDVPFFNAMAQIIDPVERGKLVEYWIDMVKECRRDPTQESAISIRWNSTTTTS